MTLSVISAFFRAYEEEIPSRIDKINQLTNDIDAQRIKNEKLEAMMKNYEVPTVDVYIELKLSLQRIEKREDQLLRKQRLRRLIEENKSGKKKTKKQEKRAAAKLTRIPTKYSTFPGRLFHGKTFNIVYNPELVR